MARSVAPIWKIPPTRCPPSRIPSSFTMICSRKLSIAHSIADCGLKESYDYKPPRFSISGCRLRLKESAIRNPQSAMALPLGYSCAGDQIGQGSAGRVEPCGQVQRKEYEHYRRRRRAQHLPPGRDRQAGAAGVDYVQFEQRHPERASRERQHHCLINEDYGRKQQRHQEARLVAERSGVLQRRVRAEDQQKGREDDFEVTDACQQARIEQGRLGFGFRGTKGLREFWDSRLDMFIRRAGQWPAG